ncbi:MAG: hypothetical protein HY543_12240 [Deltaproteobacteria bacterium]|nr:hypothetical protein [Deltaproteobacteria bacterium]
MAVNIREGSGHSLDIGQEGEKASKARRTGLIAVSLVSIRFSMGSMRWPGTPRAYGRINIKYGFDFR